MKSKIIAIALVAGLASATPAMAWDNGTAGTLLGGAGGAAIGSQFGKGNGQLVGVAVGTLLGAGIGNSIGTSMDRADAVYYGQPQPRPVQVVDARPVRVTEVYREEHGWVPPGHRKHWKKKHKHKHDHYDRYVQRDVYVDQYAYNNAPQTDYCREYTSNVIVGGKRESSYGTACYMPDGSWQIQNNR